MAASTHLPMLVGPEREALAGEPGTKAPAPVAHVFEEVYREQFPFVWRSAKRLGVRDAALDDVVQEVFVVVHRRLSGFEGRSSLKTWLFGITLRIVRDHRRATKRRDPGPPVDPDSLETRTRGPAEEAEKAEAMRALHTLLDAMDDERREVFVMAELEQMTMPEIADVLAINLNTAYARLRVARHEFEEGLERYRARDQWRLR